MESETRGGQLTMSADTKLTVVERAGRLSAGTAAKWEPLVGYSRAVRSGSFIAVSGTVGLQSDGTFPPSAGAQARRALEIIRTSVEALGGRVEDIVRTRIFVTEIDRWQEIGDAHREVFADLRPATTMVEVSRLIDPAALVEIEADAIVPG